MKIGILGGGLTGLTLARLLSRHDVEVLEAYERPGGLCRSFEWNGFVGDHGGHILFSKDREALSYVTTALGGNVHRLRRENKILYQGIYTKYPFENGLGVLPPEDRFSCLYHFLFDRYPRPSNLEEWCYYTFGKGISDAYLLPYNRKIWKMEPRRLSLSWVERIPKPPPEDVIKSALGIETEGYLHQLYFHYPRRHGIEALIHALARGVKVTTGFHVDSIERQGGRWVVGSRSGEERSYDRIISTLPVFDLFRALRPMDPEVRRLVGELRYNSICVVLVCVSVPRRHDFSALYIPDRRILFHRLCSMDFFSLHNAPPGCSAYIAEVTTRSWMREARWSDKRLADTVARQLVSLNLVRGRDIEHLEVRRQKYAYVLNDAGYEDRLRRIHTYLRKRSIPVCGRFAEFRYLNMDACVRSAFSLAERLERTWGGR